MNIEEFKKEMQPKLGDIGVTINEDKLKKFFIYKESIIEWNKKINLTAITDEKEIILKHFVDSLTISKQCEAKTIIDIGTGAGFPGIPLKILNDDSEITLLDSLNKRIAFLNEMIKELELKKVQTIHGRSEDVAKQKDYREKYDVAVSRAVAPMNILVEYMLPFVKIGGKCICMKGANIDELEESKKAIDILGGKILSIEEIILPNSDIKRNNIIIEKIKNTPEQFPRKAGTPSKQPIS